MSQLENIEAIEKRLWSSADNLRANSNYASNEYFLPVMGLIFLRHAYSRYLAVKDDIVASLPKRGGVTRPLTKEDFSRKSAIFLQPESQFDRLVSLPDSVNRGQAIVDAMSKIEDDYPDLRGVLPKAEYQELDNDVLAQLLRTFNDPALEKASGDIFGRIYEYFLTGFADQKAHDGGEFFTPVALVQLITNIIEPDHGQVLDPACGSGGMFVQSAHFVERLKQNPTEKLVFFGMEKNATTIRLAKMNLAVHGLEGNIQQAITYYQDPHELVGKADFVMANPPFNVDEVDAGKIENDPRLKLGLPGITKKGAAKKRPASAALDFGQSEKQESKGKISNGNYLWISYFYHYLNPAGRAGFVMSSQASSAGRDEAKVRQALIQTGAVDVMIAIRSNFFYTRTVPCELWFLDRGKPEAHRDKVLMIDARNVYRKVTRKIYDFSPEQLNNLSSIVWLYRGQPERFLSLVTDYLEQTLSEARHCFEIANPGNETLHPLPDYLAAQDALNQALAPFLKSLAPQGEHSVPLDEWQQALATLRDDAGTFQHAITQREQIWQQARRDNASLQQAAAELAPLAETSRDLIKQADLVFKLAMRLVDYCDKDLNARDSEHWKRAEINRARKVADETRKIAVDQLKQVRYFHRQAHWLQDRFPQAVLRDVEGLVKLVDQAELAANDWSLTPGRYVGVAPEEVDEDFDFEAALRDIHVELQGLNDEAAVLAAKIARNFEELGV